MKVARIILIEDNPADVLLVRLALNENHIEHSLIEFESGADAVEALCGLREGLENAEPPDAILMDLNTPRTNAVDVLRRLRERFAYIPITIVTSSRARADRLMASRHGARYLEKPSDLQSFLDSVAGAVKQMLEPPRPVSL